MEKKKSCITVIVLLFMMCLFIYSDAVAKEINALNIISFKVNDTAVVEDQPIKSNEVYSIIIRDDTTKFMAALDVKEYSQEQISQYKVEDFKKVLLQEKGFISFVSFEKNNVDNVPTDILVYDSYAGGMEMRSKWYIFTYKNYFFHFITQAPKGNFFESNSNTLGKIINTIKFVQSEAIKK